MATEFRIALREVMRRKGITNEDMAARLGIHAVTVSKLLNDRMRMTEKRMKAFSEALAMSIEEIYRAAGMDTRNPARPEKPPGPDLPVYGLAAGSVLGNHSMSNEPVEFVPCPPGLARVREAYALIVTGSSMEPRYFAGDMIFLHPGRPARPGDHVVVQEERDGGTISSIKCFVKETDTHIVTLQYNPRGEVKFPRRHVTAVHRVLTTNELFGMG